jgi:hypothetical protein
MNKYLTRNHLVNRLVSRIGPFILMIKLLPGPYEFLALLCREAGTYVRLSTHFAGILLNCPNSRVD